jgi:hypothetical protein
METLLGFAGLGFLLASPFLLGLLVSRDSRTDARYAHLRGERS